MKFTIACTYCQKEYPVDEAMIGKRVKCKKCGEVFIVTSPAPPAPQQGAEDAIDLSAFDESAAPAPIYNPPPIAPSRSTAAPPVYTPPPMMPPPIPRRNWNSGWNYGGQKAWWSVPVALILIGLRVYYTFHNHKGWNTESAANMTVDQKRDQTAANLRQLGPELNRVSSQQAPDGMPGQVHTFHFQSNLPHSIFVSPFESGGITSTDYKYLHIEAFKNPNLSNIIVMYDDCELQADDGTTVYRANGSVEHLSKEDFQHDRDGDQVAVLQSHGIFVQPRPTPINSPQITQSPPTPAPQPIAVVDNTARDLKRSSTSANLRYIATELHSFYSKDNSEFPPSIDFPLGQSGTVMFRGSELHSAFGPAGSRGNFVYRHYDAMATPRPHDAIIVYDQAERNADTGTMVLRADDSIDFVANSDFDSAIQASDLAAADAHAKYLKPPSATVPPPPSPGPAATNIPAHAWSAQPDPPTTQPAINAHTRKLYTGRAKLYFPPQPSDFVLVCRDNVDTKYNSEVFDLHTGQRAYILNLGNALMDPILSPDGKYFIGRTMSGAGEATTFQVASMRLRNIAQTLTAPPGKCAAPPIPIGFTDSGQVLTVADGVQVWDLKQGTLLRQISLDNKRDPTDLFAVSATGKLVAWLSLRQNSITLISTDSGKVLGSSPLPDASDRQQETPNQLTALLFSPDGKEVATLVGGKHIYVWTIADGSLAGNFALATTLDDAANKVGQKNNSMIYTPDSQGWLIAGDRIIDRATGLLIYNMPDFHEPMADEIGTRRMVDAGHIMLTFVSTSSNRSAIEVMPFDATTLEKNRTGVRAANPPPAPPATQPQ